MRVVSRQPVWEFEKKEEIIEALQNIGRHASAWSRQRLASWASEHKGQHSSREKTCYQQEVMEAV